MIIFLYGPDGYRLKENVDIIVGAYRKKHENGMSHYRFDLDPVFANKGRASNSDSFDDLANAVKSVSFFDEAKLAIVKNLFSAEPALWGKLSALINDLKVTADKKTVLVFVENKAQKDLEKVSKDLFAFLSAKPNLVRNVEYLGGSKLSNWVRNKFRENDHNVSPTVADLLIDMVGNESWALANEISKLSNYRTSRSPASGSITEKDINLLVNRKEDSKIFDLVDAVGSQNKAKAFEMIYRLTNSGHDSHYLLSMLVYHFENLLSVSDLFSRSLASGNGVPTVQVIAKKCGLHPFVARKAVSQAGKFSKEDLLSKFNRLAGLDISSKNGLINLEDALYNFVCSN